MKREHKIKILLLPFFVICLMSPAYAEVLLTLKNGKILKWQNYEEMNNQYCTVKADGKICIPKDIVVSIGEPKKGKLTPEGATVIIMPARPKEEEEKDIEQKQQELERWKKKSTEEETLREKEKKSKGKEDKERTEEKKNFEYLPKTRMY